MRIEVALAQADCVWCHLHQFVIVDIGTGRRPELGEHGIEFAFEVVTQQVCALHLAAGNNHRGCVEVLLRMGANPNAVDNWSTCPLFEAVSRGHYEVADCIKDGGGKMLMGDPGSKLCALCYKGDLSQLGALLKYGVDPDSADYDGRCALHLAAAEGFLQCTSVLLQHGAKADVQDRWGNTPLSEAQANERGDVAAALRRALAAPAS